MEVTFIRGVKIASEENFSRSILELIPNFIQFPPRNEDPYNDDDYEKLNDEQVFLGVKIPETSFLLQAFIDQSNEVSLFIVMERISLSTGISEIPFDDSKIAPFQEFLKINDITVPISQFLIIE